MFYGIFGDRDDVCREFHISGFDGEILIAAYEYEDYSGDAFVIYRHDGKLYWVTGSHCSCYGLEDQWSPVEMPIEGLLRTINSGYGLLNSLKTECLEALERELPRVRIGR